MNYISLIEELKKRGSIPGLDAIQGLLEELGHPEDDLKIVHIAGTNGKGSVFAYLSSILMAAGFKVGRYISPTCLLYTSVDIEAVIVCERESHKRIIIGKKGAMIKEIGTQARVEMENLLDMKVNLRLWVKVRKDWRDSDILLKNYGYNKKEL